MSEYTRNILLFMQRRFRQMPVEPSALCLSWWTGTYGQGTTKRAFRKRGLPTYEEKVS